MNRKRGSAPTHVATLVFCVGLGWSYAVTADAGRYPIYEQAPAPEELAELLFPTRFRGAQQSTASTVDQPRKFGMMVNFNFDSSEIRTDSQSTLNTVGEMLTLEQVEDQAIVIEGHTDSIGSTLYNQDLSVRRAAAIKGYLISRFEIPARRLVVVGKGENELYDESSPKSAQNRRVVFRPVQTLLMK